MDEEILEHVVHDIMGALERCLGPKLLGVFPGGRFEQFIPSRPLQCREISKPAIGRIIAPMMARVHTLDVPITKEPEVLNCARGWLAKFRQTAGGKRPIDIRCTAARVPAHSYPSSITCDQLERELNFVEDFLIKSKSPVVFSHNDLQEGNILLVADYHLAEDGSIRNQSGEDVTMDPLVLIDFEYCSYNYRGFDLGNHFCEYGIDYNCDEPPYYKIYSEMFNVTEQRRNFCKAYRDEVYRSEIDKLCDNFLLPRKVVDFENDDTYGRAMRDSGDNPHFPSDLVTGDRRKDLDRLVTESTLFMADAVIQFDYGSYARDRLALYYQQKASLKKFMDSQ
ncbi:Choline/ethanolamine kinase [Ancylostoma duodenale]|uniref:Choline/ethanolamine kinase n=1 Tax=Ancylostoma duodenale TaxID=51022 RepID=A0A0C2D891_9BILA|nr:Choline/ethanolamine kinase [Ancylostoma duodenale]